jgi:mannose/fructose-specific phosphotransferase system component IIA
LSVGLVIVTHGESGADLIAEAEFILGESLDAVRAVPFNHSEGHREEIYQIHAAISSADAGDGVLVLTDLMGASPSNRVATLLEHHDGVMVTGVNLAMLLCVWANRNMPLGQLTRKAVDCGKRSVKIFQQ